MQALTAQGESFQNYTLVRDPLDLPPCARWAAPISRVPLARGRLAFVECQLQNCLLTPLPLSDRQVALYSPEDVTILLGLLDCSADVVPRGWKQDKHGYSGESVRKP